MPDPLYLTVAEYRAFGGIQSAAETSVDMPTIPNELQVYDDDTLESYLRAASRHIDERCGRGDGAFSPSASAARTFIGDGDRLLRVDGFYGGVAVTDGDGVVDDYRARPFNKQQFLWLERTENKTWKAGEAYTVTATFGMAETPNDIKVAVKQLADLARVAGPLAITRRSLESGEYISGEARGILLRLISDWRVLKW